MAPSSHDSKEEFSTGVVCDSACDVLVVLGTARPPVPAGLFVQAAAAQEHLKLAEAQASWKPPSPGP